jgi:hypothetical protein
MTGSRPPTDDDDVAALRRWAADEDMDPSDHAWARALLGRVADRLASRAAPPSPTPEVAKLTPRQQAAIELAAEWCAGDLDYEVTREALRRAAATLRALLAASPPSETAREPWDSDKHGRFGILPPSDPNEAALSSQPPARQALPLTDEQVLVIAERTGQGNATLIRAIAGAISEVRQAQEANDG